MISLIVTIETPPDKIADFLRVISPAAHAARTLEPGCLRFEVTQVQDRPHVFVLVELYADQAAVEAHRAAPHSLLLKQQLEEGKLVVSKSSVQGTLIPD